MHLLCCFTINILHSEETGVPGYAHKLLILQPWPFLNYFNLS
jgi:hypothetical protein